MNWTETNFIGQQNVKNKLDIFALPSIEKNGSCDHILFEGMSGTGKTTLAKIIARDNIKVVMAPSIRTKADILSVLTSLEDNDFLFLDEIHRLDDNVEEILYQAMDDKQISISIGKLGDTNLIELDLPNFTLIGATTLSGLMSKPLKDRFGLRIKMDPYNIGDIVEIIKNNIPSNSASEEDIVKLANNCKDTPRIAKNISNRFVDYVLYLKVKNLTSKNVDDLISIMGLKEGLNEQDIRYLELLWNNGGTLGSSSIAKNMQIELVNIVADIEPFLLSSGYIQIFPKGRTITTKGKKVIKRA